MNNDRELLEQAAKAAGIEVPKHLWADHIGTGIKTMSGIVWNPLTDDGDALRLAVKLRLDIQYNDDSVYSGDGDVLNHQLFEWNNDDPYAATRRAIVRAAAEIGKLCGDAITAMGDMK